MNLIETNPAVFIQQLTAAIADGFYVHNTVEGAPSLTSVQEVKLFPGKPEVIEVSGDTLHVQAYGSMDFLLSVQNAILNGYVPDLQTVNFFGLKEVVLKKEQTTKQPVQVETTTKQRGRPAKSKEV